MMDFIVFVVVALILGCAVWYVVRAKKSGKKCIGCPDGCCNKKDGSGCTCCGNSAHK